MFKGKGMIPLAEENEFMLITIADNPIMSAVQRVGQASCSWAARYELTRLPEPELLEALKVRV